MISSSVHAFCRALATRFEAARRPVREHLRAEVTAAAEGSAAAYDDQHLPGRVGSNASSVAAAGRR